MDIKLENIKTDKTNDKVFTATLLLDGTPLLNITSKATEHWPDLDFHARAVDANANWARLEAQGQREGHEHLYAYVMHIYQNRQRETAEAAAVAAQEQRLRKLCLDYLVIKLPHYQEGEYMLASEVSTTLITQHKAKGTLAAKVGGEIHKEQIRAMFAEINGRPWANKIEFYNDRYVVTQAALKLVA